MMSRKINLLQFTDRFKIMLTIAFMTIFSVCIVTGTPALGEVLKTQNLVKDSTIYKDSVGDSLQIYMDSVEQIKTAFLDESSMMAFIDGLYVTVENAFKLQEERLVALAANTAIADALNSTNKAQARNLLAEYNTKHSSSLTAVAALEDASFLKFASMEIKRVIDNMSVMSSVYNKEHYHTFTSSENLVVEMLSHFVSASEMYLQADTFHNELTKLPNFEKVPYWQSSGDKFSFESCSSIKVKHSDLVSGSNTTGVVEQSGIICFVHDIENVAAYFGNRRSWEMNNPRSEVMIHGEKADKGFAIDGHANAVVFYIA